MAHRDAFEGVSQCPRAFHVVGVHPGQLGPAAATSWSIGRLRWQRPNARRWSGVRRCWRRATSIGRQAVLHEVECAAGPQHPADLGQCPHGVRNRAQRPGAQHVIDARVRTGSASASEPMYSIGTAHRAAFPRPACGPRWRVDGLDPLEPGRVVRMFRPTRTRSRAPRRARPRLGHAGPQLAAAQRQVDRAGRIWSPYKPMPPVWHGPPGARCGVGRPSGTVRRVGPPCRNPVSRELDVASAGLPQEACRPTVRKVPAVVFVQEGRWSCDGTWCPAHGQRAAQRKAQACGWPGRKPGQASPGTGSPREES